MRIVCIGDIGVTNNIIHIGDEAMFDELVSQLRRRGITEIVGLSSNPAESADRYGITSIRRIGFFDTSDTTRARAEDRVDRVLRSAQGVTNLLASNDPAWAVIDAIRSSDGVAIAGGGNLMSTWPTHIFERATLGALARLFSKPFVVTGQTIGPYLVPEDEALVTRMLSSAKMVGLRERPSYEYSIRLGVPAELLTQTIDDASFLSDGEIDGDADAVATAAPSTPYCVVSLANHLNGADAAAFDARMAELLDHVAASTALEIVFFAHFGSTDSAISYGDTLVHERVQALMGSVRTRTVIPTSSTDAARLARQSALSISLRYHPAVFAVSAGVPTIGIAVDDYTTTKLTGALGNFNQSSVLSVAGLLDGDGPALVNDVWNARFDIAEGGVVTTAAKREGSARWWDAIAATFTGPTGDGPATSIVGRDLL